MDRSAEAHAALWYRRFGPPAEVLSLEQADRPARIPGRVRVQMTAAPINPSDLIPITGAYRHRVEPPQVAGYEGVGVIVEADDTHLLGRRALPLRGEGTWQTSVQVVPERLILVPDDISDDVAARAYINPLAALLMLERWPATDRRILLTGGGSSCARLLGAWALADGAREVVAVHRSPGHSAALAGLGFRPIAEDDLALPAIARGCDLVFDAVGGNVAASILPYMARGDFVSYGLLSGQPFGWRTDGVRIHRFHLRDGFESMADSVWRGWFDRLWPRLRVAPMPAVRRFPIEEWRAALAAFDEPGRSFKPLLEFGSE
ncbi:zinc-dependent alcohol dehydrogenase family protein [Paludisphaera rhizosphaerae]|uniref:zinc-dependent alcohol dehydrogenase family protein n=1 Tax=Paludisphaera rhizosphaerae TaxID=2711216 RepID=UPI0013ED6EC4|nr:zinc-dependent alcohol dehydrogenase family protein [Paludisphaera rhizosphaerae]